MGKVVSLLKRCVLKVKYISLVNLIANREVVKELVADKMTVIRVNTELQSLLYDPAREDEMQQGYAEVLARLGEPGAPERAARRMVALLAKNQK